MSQSDHTDDDSEDGGTELGFVRLLGPGEHWRLHRCYFPSKVGGKPAWLNSRDIPTTDDIKCSVCGHTMGFLLQIYAPSEDNDNAFHRTIYVFCCKTQTCYQHNCSQPFKVLRCQLPRKNDFYNYNPPDYDSPQFWKSCKDFAQVCTVCGFAASKVCSKCRKESYCCKEHQVLHWKAHKSVCCKEDAADVIVSDFAKITFPEYEVVMEHEEPSDVCSGESHSENIPITTNAHLSISELEQFANVNANDREFTLFREATSTSPDQVLRYDKAGSPLWCSGENTISENQVPDCGCGAKRHFEFQVMPQLLNHLKVQNSVEGPCIDWGVLAVYTCSADCQKIGLSYYEEYLHKQDFGLTE